MFEQQAADRADWKWARKDDRGSGRSSFGVGGWGME